MKCLIIAAGKGCRLRSRGNSKPLIQLLGAPLIERVIRSAAAAGANEFYVVTGYNGGRVRSFLDDLARRTSIKINHVTNEEWDKENGLSVLKARRYLHEPFLLLMSDHLFDPDIPRRLLQQPPREGEITLAVDGIISNPLVDTEDATKVIVEDGKVRDIGKKLDSFNGFDSGIFVCSPAIFDALERSISEHGDSSLTGGVKYLAARGRVNAFDIQGGYWIDVDDPDSMDKAERTLLEQLKQKPTDGPVSRHINRRISTQLSRYLVKTKLTPNQISFISFLLCILASFLFAMKGYIALAMGGIVAQFASIVDGCDGEVARLKYQQSAFGAWFDAVLDRYADAFLLFGLTWHSCTNGIGIKQSFLVGFMAIIGSFMLSYTADKYDNLMRERIEAGRTIRIGRDVRVFLIFIGALLDKPFLTLAAVAVLMNAETMRRVIVCRGHE